MAFFELDHVRMDAPLASRHLHRAPGFPFVVGDLEHRGVTRKTIFAVGADPVAEDPPPVGEDLNRLAAERSLPREHNVVIAPRFSAVCALLAAHDGGILHVVLTLRAGELCSVHRPYLAVRSEKE